MCGSMYKQILALGLSLMVPNRANAQSDSLVPPVSHSAVYNIEVAGLGTSGSRIPFWLRANQYGTVPHTTPAGLVRLGTNGYFGRSINHTNRRFSYGVEVVGIAESRPAMVLPEAYLSVDRGWFSIWVGRKKEIIGLGDSTLTSGFYSWSGNARPITKVQVGTNGFVPLGFTNGLIAINAFFAYGWFPNTDSIQGSYLHQKVLFGRIGKPNWKVKLYGGLIHTVQWAGRSDYLSKNQSVNGRLPSSFKDYLSVIIARQPNQEASYAHIDKVNQIGNHLGSIDVGAEFDLPRWNVLSYYQHPYEDKSGLKFVNFPDGLYGLRFKRKAPVGTVTPFFRVDQFLFEYLTTLNQSGFTLGERLQGIDDYFNNFQYINGWTIKRQVIGTPFISPRNDVKPVWQNVLTGPVWHRLAIINNRVQVLHVGASGVFQSGVQLQTRLSYSVNQGTIRIPFGQTVGQLNGVVWLTWPLRWLGGSELRTAVAIDSGTLYGNTSGAWLSIRKTVGSQRFIQNQPTLR